MNTADVPTVAAITATQTGAAVAVLGGLNAQEVAMIGGFLVGVIGLIYNMWHSSQMRKIARGHAQGITKPNKD